MKKMIAALMLTAAVATPALAAGYRQGGAITPDPGYAYNETSHGKAYRAQQGDEAFAYAPGVAASPSWNAPVYAMDPDPTVRLQLQNQPALFDR
jgi:opacity protein-like surface antigen